MVELTVYVVERDEKIKDELVEMISAGEYLRVVGANGDGKEAFDEILKLKPNVLVTELILSSFDGYKLIEKIREVGLDMQIIVLSSLVGDGFITRAMDAGANYYMIKPANHARLNNMITESFGIENNSINKVVEKSFESKIANIFMTIGIPAHIKGYRFLRDAIKLAVDKPNIMNSITKELYPSVAKIHSTTPSKVERAMRHAIEVGWNKGKLENINNLFGIKVYSSMDKPTNGEFVALIADKILIDDL